MNKKVQNRSFVHGIEHLEARTMLAAAIPAFAAQVTFSAGPAPSLVNIADLNRDGKPDLVVALDGSQQLLLYAGNGDGTFAVRQTVGLPGHPAAVALADLNRDAIPDVIVAGDSNNVVSVFPGNGDGTVSSPHTFAVGNSPRSVAVADFNRDGNPDVAVANYADNTVTVLFGDGTGVLQSPQTYPVGSQPLSIISTDIDLDGKVDLALVDHGAHSMGILFGNGNGAFQAQRTFDTSPFIAAPSIVVAGLLSGSARPSLSVGGDATQNMLDFYLGAYPTQISTLLLNAGTVPSAMAAADFNVDGAPDLVITSATSNTVYVSQNSQVVPARSFAVGAKPASVAAADLNGDGRPDIVVANKGDNTIGILLGDVPPKVLSITRTTPGDILNAPDSLSWVVTFNEPVTSVDLSDFTLPFAGPSATTMSITPSSASVYTVTVGGISGFGTAGLNLVDDGSIRDAAGNPLQPGGASVFQAPQSFSAGGSSADLYGQSQLADLNNDGRLDLVLVNTQGMVSRTLLGNGNGTFQAPVTFTTANNFAYVQVADVNRDGRPDILVTNAQNGQNAVGVLLGNGDGTFAQALTFAASARPNFIAVGDVNGDGKPDMAVSNYPDKSIGILIGNGDGTFLPQKTFAAGQLPGFLALSDVNRDGKLDLVVSDFLGNAIDVLSGNGDGTFGAAQTFAVTSPGVFELADANGDGKADVIIGSPATNQLDLLRGNGDGTFQPPSVIASNIGMNSSSDPFSVADVNNDGRTDIAVFGAGVVYGNGDGTFTPVQPYAPFILPTASIDVGDVNGDGKPDVVQGGSGNIGARPTAFFVSLGAPNGSVTGPAYRLVPVLDQITLDPNNAQIVRLKADPDGTHIDWSVSDITFGQCLINDPNGLTISGAATNLFYSIVLDYTNGNPLTDILHLNGPFVISGFQSANPFAGKTLDVGPKTVQLYYGNSPDPIASIRAALSNGYNHGSWNGSADAGNGAVTSALAANDPTRLAIGYVDVANSGVNNTLTLRCTLAGDTNLNGTVDIFDLNAVLPNFNSTGDWAHGDLNYDGKVDIFDLNALLPNFNQSLPAVSPSLAPSADASAQISAAAVNWARTATATSSPPAEPNVFNADGQDTRGDDATHAATEKRRRHSRTA